MKNITFILFLCICLFLFIPLFFANKFMPSYPERKTLYRFSEQPIQVFYFDSIEEGRDHDSLYIFDISKDNIGFLSYVKNNKKWSSLPLPQYVLQNALCDPLFNPNMESMLSSSSGYWYWEPQSYEFYVFNDIKGLLYIRSASVITNFQYIQSKDKNN